jgi:large subunit ribosomal protein L29
MAKTSELRDLDEVELETRLREGKAELFNLRFQHVTGQLDNSARLGEVRRDIARIKTMLRELEIATAEAAEADQGLSR